MAVLAAGCGGEQAPDGISRREAEFNRHLRLGIDQMRRFLPESAEAEFAKCAQIEPENPELLFQQARLHHLAPGGTPEFGATALLLSKALEQKPESVKAHRLLYEMHSSRRSHAPARRHHDAILRAYGEIGRMEMDSFHRLTLGQEPLDIYQIRVGGATGSDYRELTGAMAQLQQTWDYAPSAAIPILEKLLGRYPELASLRFSYAKHLITANVRVNYADQPGLPLMSSKLILDYAQSHLERVFDQIHPLSPLATRTMLQLSRIAMLMADYDEAIALTDILLGEMNIDDSLRRELKGQKGIALYKQGRHENAIRHLEESLHGTLGRFDKELSHRWLLHLVHEEAGTPEEERRISFEFRQDLPRAAEASPLAFEDIAPGLKINKLDGLGPSAWGDYDGDGDFDLFVSGCDSYGALYRNDGDLFEDSSREAGLFNAQSGYSATFADYDNDGFPDLYIGRDGWNGPAPNSLYRNNGDGTFTDVTESAGLGEPGSSFVHAWSDVDRDGDLDLFIANGIVGSGDTNRLYRNEGNGSFTDITEDAGLAERQGTRTIGFAFGDYDGDGWPDLFVSGVFMRNRLYRNQGDGTFEEVAEKAGVDGEAYMSTGYVAFFVDYDNDTYPDILKTSLAEWKSVLEALSIRFPSLPDSARERMYQETPRLYRNNRDGTFTDVSEEARLVHPIGIMGANVADLDNDGFVDFYFGTGDPQIERMEADRFYLNNGDGTFTDMTFAAGLGNIGKGHGITFMDFDGDGDLEIYAPEGGFVHGDAWPNSFYVNRKETRNHWLHVDLEGVESNRGGVDAKLVLEAGGLRLLREVKNGEGFGSSNSPTVEFGLGRSARIDRLEIHWPSGATQAFDDVPIDRRLFVKEGDHWKEWRPLTFSGKGT
jgi:tetratricopeptide (TPR) repeat protein